MERCKFDTVVELKDDKVKYRCSKCGYETVWLPSNVAADMVYAPCGVIVSKEPSLLDKVINFGKAMTKHVVSGMEYCTEEQTQERFEICKACPFIKDNNGVLSCGKCGCGLSDKTKILNKLALKSQSCPIGKWGIIED